MKVDWELIIQTPFETEMLEVFGLSFTRVLEAQEIEEIFILFIQLQIPDAMDHILSQVQKLVNNSSGVGQIFTICQVMKMSFVCMTLPQLLKEQTMEILTINEDH